MSLTFILSSFTCCFSACVHPREVFSIYATAALVFKIWLCFLFSGIIMMDISAEHTDKPIMTQRNLLARYIVGLPDKLGAWLNDEVWSILCCHEWLGCVDQRTQEIPLLVCCFWVIHHTVQISFSGFLRTHFSFQQKSFSFQIQGFAMHRGSAPKTLYYSNWHCYDASILFWKSR